MPGVHQAGLRTDAARDHRRGDPVEPVCGERVELRPRHEFGGIHLGGGGKQQVIGDLLGSCTPVVHSGHDAQLRSVAHRNPGSG